MQDYSAADIYLENEVFTASPRQLRLMLISAALRHTQQTIEQWQQGNFPAGTQSLTRAQALVSELQTSIRGGESDLAQQVAALYTVLYCDLLEAQLDTDISRVEAVMKALVEERETWQQLCALDAPPVVATEFGRTHDLHTAQDTTAAPHFQSDSISLAGLSLEGLSLEA